MRMHHLVTVEMETDVLAANRAIAERVNRRLSDAGVWSVEFVGAVGSGKTLIIERLAALLAHRGVRAGAVVGDVAGDDDARRLGAIGLPVVNINTGKECHLDAHGIDHALDRLGLGDVDVLFLENVGNLVCPADFPLGADRRVVVVSVTEGDDMVRKHPVIFGLADVAVLNKVDLAAAVEIDLETIRADYARLRPGRRLLLTDAKHGRGMEELALELGLDRVGPRR